MRETEEELEIDLLDLMKWVLRRWGVLAVGAIAGLLLSLGYIALLFTRTTASAQYQKTISTKTALTPEEAEYVETYYDRYRAYEEVQDFLSDYFASSAYWELDLENSITKTAEYYIESGISNIVPTLSALSLHQEDYDAIARIIGANSDSVRDLVGFHSISETADENYSFRGVSGEEPVIVVPEMDVNREQRRRVVFTVTIVAAEAGQCDAIHEIVDTAMQRETEKLRTVDDTMLLRYIGADYDSVTSDYISSRQGALLDRQASIVTMMKNLDERIDESFSDEQKAYFQALKDYEEQREEKRAGAKYLLIGILGGAFAGGMVLALRYLFDGKVKTASELGRRLADLGTESGNGGDEKGLPLVAADLAMLLERRAAGKRLLLYAEAEDQARARALAEELGRHGIEARCGDPKVEVEFLSYLKEHGAVVYLVHLKRTRRETLQGWVSLSERHAQEALGVVTVE